jgi:hypothetical protein
MLRDPVAVLRMTLTRIVVRTISITSDRHSPPRPASPDGHQLLSVGAFPSAPPMPRVSLGAPPTAMSRLGRAWRRSFAGGVVVVNPATPSFVAYPGGSYINKAGCRVSAVFLPPARGDILRTATRP